MKMLSMKRPRPSIEIATPVAASLPAKASAVNVEPWTPFCLSSGDSRGVDLPASLSDEGEDLSSKVTLQGSHGEVRVKRLSRALAKPRWLFRYPRSEPASTNWLFPCQIKLTFGCRS